MKTSFIAVLFLAITSTLFAQDYTIENNEIKIRLPIAFKTLSNKLTPESDTALRLIARVLKEKSYISTLRVEAHVDNAGDFVKSQEITEARALEVCTQLFALGVDCNRLLPVGFGSSKPIAANNTIEGRAANRRIVFVIAALRGKAIGGMPLDGSAKVAAIKNNHPCNFGKSN